MGFLDEAREQSATESEPLRERDRAEYNGKTLVVAQRSSGTLVLAREHERGVKGADGKRSADNGTERVLKATSALADFADAVDAGLL
jgi:hypothetical protein